MLPGRYRLKLNPNISLIDYLFLICRYLRIDGLFQYYKSILNLPTESAISCFSGFGSTWRFCIMSLIKLFVLRAKVEALTSHSLLTDFLRDMGTQDFWQLRGDLHLE